MSDHGDPDRASKAERAPGSGALSAADVDAQPTETSSAPAVEVAAGPSTASSELESTLPRDPDPGSGELTPVPPAEAVPLAPSAALAAAAPGPSAAPAGAASGGAAAEAPPSLSPLTEPLPTLPSSPPGPFGGTHRRQLLGASLWTFGALLWAYIVMGEWVLNLKLPEGVGFFVVFGVYGGAWFVSVRDLRAQASRRWHAIVPGIAGLFLFLFTLLFVATLMGSTRRTAIAMLSVGLWFSSALVYWLGRRLTALAPVRRRGWRLLTSVLLWVVSGLVTLVSLVSTMSRA